MAKALSMYYNNYIYKESCMVSYDMDKAYQLTLINFFPFLSFLFIKKKKNIFKGTKGLDIRMLSAKA